MSLQTALPNDPALVAALLRPHGWLLDCHSAIARKSYATAVGPKEALAYASYWPNSQCLYLTGEYLSEGSNALAIHGVLLPNTANAAMIKPLVDHFAVACDTAVANTYAARLLKEPA